MFARENINRARQKMQYIRERSFSSPSTTKMRQDRRLIDYKKLEWLDVCLLVFIAYNLPTSAFLSVNLQIHASDIRLL